MTLKEKLYLQTLFANLDISDWQVDRLIDQEKAIKEEAINLVAEANSDTQNTFVAMQSIFDAITLENSNTNNVHYQPISPLNWNEDGYQFPILDANLLNKKVQNTIDKQVFKQEYNKENPNLTKLYYTFKKYGWSIPFSLDNTTTDISLFEQSRLAAAIAVCAYDFAIEKNDNLSGFNVEDKNEKRYLLVCADLAGIQSFIYNIGHKNALKALKGRSFYLQQMLVSIANKIIKELYLFDANIIYSSGGKFYLLLPNTNKVKDILEQYDCRINSQLLERYNGNLALLFDCIELSGNDLCKGKINIKWDELNTKLNKSVKNRKFASLVTRNFFTPNLPSGNVELCYNTGVELCTIESLANAKKLNEEPINLHYQYKINNNKNIYVEVSTNKEEEDFQNVQPKYICEEQYHAVILGHALRRRNSPIEGKVPLLDIDEIDLKQLVKHQLFSTNNGKLKLNKDDFGDADGWQFYGGNWVVYVEGKNAEENEEEEKVGTFAYWIQNSTNIPYLAVLRMDVDNLGLIFKEGFKDKEGKPLATFSRLVQLSSMLDFFFSGYLNKLENLYWSASEGVVEKENDTKLADFMQIVYSGGDDLFIVGRWDIMPDVAVWIRNKFAEFTGNNPHLTLSAGISLFGTKYPLFKVAQMAGDAESMAKSYKRDTKAGAKDVTKNAISFLDNPLSWSDFEKMSHLVKQWVVDLDADKMPRSLLRTIQEIYHNFAKGETILEASKLSYIEKNQYSSWRWHAAYRLQRSAEQYNKYKQQIEELKQFLFANTLQTEKEPLLILYTASLWADFLTRKNN